MLTAFVAVLAAVAEAARQSVEMETSTFETHARHEGWRDAGDADAAAPHAISIALKLRNADKLELALLETSNPASAKYLRHWTKEQVERLTAPSARSVRVVRDWIAAAFGADARVDDSFHGYLNVETTVRDVERALEADLRLFSHAKLEQRGRAPIARTHAYRVPLDVAEHIDFVAGLVRFPSMRNGVLGVEHKLGGVATPAAAAAASSAVRQFNATKLELMRRALLAGDPNWPSLGIVPDTILDRYGLNSFKPSSKGTTQMVAQFLGQMWSNADLQEFYLIFQQSLLGGGIAKTYGPNSIFTPGVESNLDTQYITAVSKGLKTTVFSNETTGSSGQEPFLSFTQALLALPNAEFPAVVSVSYGDDEDSLTAAFMKRVNLEFAQVGLRGATVVFAAGDSGADCMSSGNQFQPDFPASSPYVLTVGGTDAEDLETGEEVINSIGGSGFSNVFAQPPWQKTAVQSWLSQAGSSAPKPSYYNATGRAYPDISAFSNAFWVVYAFIPNPVAGTSCAAPTMAATIAAIVDHRAANGLPSLGLLGPALYAAAANNKTFSNPIKSGCNLGCSNNNGIGFCALPSGQWSPVAGFGPLVWNEAIKVLNK